MESAGRRALMESARVEFAERGPGGVSLRAIAARSGCSHPLVARHFGNKKGLELAVVEQLADSVEHIVDCVGGEPAERFATLTHQLRADPVAVPLLVRCVLGDLDDRALLPALSTLATGLAGTLLMDGGGRDDQTALRRRMAAFAGMSLELGWLTLDRFLTAGTDMGSVPGPLRDDAMAEAAGYVIDACADPSVQLRSHSSPPSAGAGAASVPAEDVEVEGGAPQRLVQAAADLFAEKGPVATSTRELAERAGVGQRVIYRHFVSKEALLSEALDAVWSPAYLAALAPEGLDLDLVVALVRQRSRGARIIARAMVDGVDVDLIRSRFPIMDAGLGLFDEVPAGELRGPSDPRVAVAGSVALALGSAIWEPDLRAATGITPAVPVDRVVAHASRALLRRARPDRPLAPPSP